MVYGVHGVYNVEWANDKSKTKNHRTKWKFMTEVWKLQKTTSYWQTAKGLYFCKNVWTFLCYFKLVFARGKQRKFRNQTNTGKNKKEMNREFVIVSNSFEPFGYFILWCDTCSLFELFFGNKKEKTRPC